MEENKEPDSAEKKSAGCCSGRHGMKSVLIIVGVLVILGGAACVAKMAIGRHGFNQVAVERNVSFGGGNIEGGRRGGMIGGGGMRGRTGESLIGKISKIDGDNITLHKDSNNKDYTVEIADTTQIRKDGEIASKTDLATGLAITVQGSANSSGQILANIIIIN
ncbi:MAG: DUF5666 domain-containing protein [Candidatus Berkelbacteria bacterium]|nr:DUF5666 domain-containing protein [Candidatus Berkelbacteria bacterium]